ncbi:class II fructose-bisphosphate aldolase [Streptomyces sp. M10(2022)]
MPLVSTGELVSAARAGAVGSPRSTSSLSNTPKPSRPAPSAGAPAILQISENAVKFHGGTLGAIAAAAAAVARASTAPLALHLDHVESVELLHQAHTEGFGSVMFDASKLSYDENVRATAEAVRWGHERGLWIEAELGKVGGKEGEIPSTPTPPASVPTRRGRRLRRIHRRGRAGRRGRLLARDDGTHRRPDHALITRLRDAVPCPLVLHGSSGVPDAEIRRAVAAGMVKINVGTALNTAFTGAVRDYLDCNPTGVDPRNTSSRLARR